MSFSQLARLSCLLILVLSVFLNESVCQAANCNDCCNNSTYTLINEPRRSTKSVWKSGEPVLCDRGLQWGWYRFKTSADIEDKMPEKAPPEFHCGTHDPIWLQDRHPTVAEGNVVRKACINSFGVQCDVSFNINVKNCSSYFVYYLRPPIYCAVAYCAGEKSVLCFNFVCSELL
ncbi:Oncoprotein-induced transcript 3 protein [Desmophyllum pertusum]|uniref:Oncoprotein-induced transcript 3 protein n=1 Tax=Desmophyllum pertusum TaxID=174260 RepID=A0A9X0CH75_9CNID|nr:Oncoprotein-induced transcript 3 protein [Desmophyllum pertusum]